MLLKLISFLLVLSALGSGIPLEYPTSDMSQFFDSRIVGGSDAPEGYAPHMVALVVDEYLMILVCGGSIVSKKLVLTAAHCIDIFVIWGELLSTFHGIVGSNRWDNRENSIFFEAFHIHPKWDWGTMKNDIGFLVVDKPLVYTQSVAPIGINLEVISEEPNSFVTGWGRLGAMDEVPYSLQILNVSAILHEVCVAAVQAVNHTDPFPDIDPIVEICTFHSFGHGICNGDSGSALVSRSSYSIIGVASWGWACARGKPDVYARPSGFKDYIQKIFALVHFTDE